MLNKKIPIASILASGIIVFLIGCYKDKTVPTRPPEITRTVTFSEDMIPIFNNSCNVSGCHSAGGQVPNLTEANAYNSLTIGNYYDTNNPESSVLYLKVSGQKGTSMPPSGVNQDYAALILAWITQGAKNN
jgi:hypothetical protein